MRCSSLGKSKNNCAHLKYYSRSDKDEVDHFFCQITMWCSRFSNLTIFFIHSRDIEKYFHGAHLTITARDEDEIDEEIFLDKVSKVSATSYNFKEKQTFGDEAPAGPVGSNHKKINPKAELPSENIHYDPLMMSQKEAPRKNLGASWVLPRKVAKII